MYAHPGKKLLFMGQEIGQREEWNHDEGRRWDLLAFDYHRKLQFLVQELNHFYRANPAMYQVDFHHDGFQWVDFRDVEHSVISFLRRAENAEDFLLFCCNFTPVVHERYRIGVPAEGVYEEVFDTDSHLFGGSNLGNPQWIQSQRGPQHGFAQSISVTLPPLAVIAFRKR
jgi:1,4-alpha-glucan branching enzyme